MPNGNTHHTFTLGLQLVTVASTLYLHPIDVLALQIGISATYYINPDLDITTNRLGLVKYLGFESYRKLVPHRFGLAKRHWNSSIKNVLFFSHFPFIGTILRTILLLLPIVVVLLFCSSIQLLDARFLLFLYLGMALSDTLHIVADILYSGFKRSL